MDWSKAKTYLIIAFLVVNFFLVGLIASEQVGLGRGSFFSRESMDNLQMLLNRKNITLAQELPRKHPKMGAIEVRYKLVEQESFQALFEDYPEAQIEADRRITLSGKGGLDAYTRASAQDFAEQFVADYKLGKSFLLSRVAASPEGRITVYYTGQYRDWFLSGSDMTFVFQTDGSFTMNRLEMEVLDVNRKKQAVITSVEAVMQAIGTIPENSVILQVSLGYMGNQYGNDPVSQTQTSTALPVWRIELQEGEDIYIPAFDIS